MTLSRYSRHEGTFYQRASFRGAGRHIHAPDDKLAGTEAMRAERLAAEQGSSALLEAMLLYYDRHHAGARA